ncbi:MAG: ATP-binding protein [SAR324 cluster bacterium]|nr:ATP-binding protein [SAR324 cluster bacterium]
MSWGEQIHPAFNLLGKLYKDARIWEGERSVERSAFYDLRLMILELENLQHKLVLRAQELGPEKALIAWSEKEKPLVQNISKQVEILLRWQTDFARQQDSSLKQGLLGLGIWIWIVASIVLLTVFVLAVFFAKRITDPLRKLRNAAQKVTGDYFINQKIKEAEIQGKEEKPPDNLDEVQTLTDAFQKMESVIRERTALLEASNRKLDQASRAKGMYLISMSHELRTPLNAIIGFAEVLLESGREKSLSEYQGDRLLRILKSGKHLLELINSLLDLSKIESGQMEVQKTEFDIENLLRDVVELLEPLMQEKTLRHEIIMQSEQQITLYTDYGKLRQVLINLLGNAIKFSDPEGHIGINCRKHETGISIAIKDSGCGITEEEQQQIFEVFHQVESSAENLQNGTGLGLALVKSLVGLLGGSVSIKSKYGTGSTFTLHFDHKVNSLP